MSSVTTGNITMTIGSKTYPVQDVVWTGLLLHEPKPAEISEVLEPQEENVNYLFEVYVIDLKGQALTGNIPVVCNNVAKATAIAALRLDLDESRLDEVKFHVIKVCEVPAWEG